jgi:hypothetical protein
MARSIRMLSRARSNRRVETSGTTERFYRLEPGTERRRGQEVENGAR